MDTRKRKIFTVLTTVLAVSLISILITSCMGPMGPFGRAGDDTGSQGIEIFEIARGDILQAIAATGSVDSESSNVYSSQVSGNIISSLQKGDAFSKGDILVEIADADMLYSIKKIEKDIENAESSLKTAKINYREALDKNHITVQQAELSNELAWQKAEAAFTSLEDAERNLRAIKENAFSTKSQIASGRSQVNSAESSYEQSLNSQASAYWNDLSSQQSAEAQIAKTAESIKQADIKLELILMELEEVKKSLDDYKIYAAYDGIVLSSDFRAGEQSNSAGGISVISSDYVISTSVSENDISKVSAGDKAFITLDAYQGIEFEGEVEKIIPISNDENGIISLIVLIGFEEVEGLEIFYGLSANTSIIAEMAVDVIYVPIQSVYKENGKSYVDLLISEQVDQENIGKSIKKVEVTTGINDYLYIEIVSGLKVGDVIVTSRI